MKIILCVKQVPDTTDIKWTENNTIQRDGLESILNPCDESALDCAAGLKKTYANTEITSVTMGPLQAERILRKTLASGADRAILLSDKKFAGADTYATGKTLAAAIKSKCDNFDIILCGQFAADGDTAQTGPSLANFLDIPHVTFVKEIVGIDGNSIVVIRETDYGEEKIKVELPAVICVLKNDKEYERPKINDIKKAQLAKIEYYGIIDIGLEAEQCGLKGSPTYVNKAFRALQKEVECQFIEDINSLAETIKECEGIS